MRHSIILRASLAGVAGVASLLIASTAHSQVTLSREAAISAAHLLASKYERFVQATPRYGVAEAVPASKKVAVAILPPGVTGVSAEAIAGFTLPSFGVTGMSMPGTKAMASVTISEVRGLAKVHLDVRDMTANRDVAVDGKDVTAPGPVTLRTTPGFMLADGHKYRLRVLVGVMPTKTLGGLVTGCVATIDEMKFVFEP